MGLVCGLLSVTPISMATEPQHDHILVNGQEGLFMPTECCWVPLPETDRIRQLRQEAMKNRCSALGGPVSTYELKNDKLLLRELTTCGRVIPFQAAFPKLNAPVEAVWLSGKFSIHLTRICNDREGVNVYRTNVTLSVVKGEIVSSMVQTDDESSCER